MLGARRFYCPANSSYESQCGPGTFCPSNSSAPVRPYPPVSSPVYLDHSNTQGQALCPLGMASNPSTAGPRSSVGQACVTCPIGTFGADPQRLQCRTCTPGYICLQGCTSATPQTVAEDNGYPCPAGSYCVNSTATPCPAGSFSPAPGLTGKRRPRNRRTSLLDSGRRQVGLSAVCPGNLFCTTGSGGMSPMRVVGVVDVNVGLVADDNGSIGTRDTFPTGATGCQCAGKHRAYQAADATCQCVPGYTSLGVLGGPARTRRRAHGAPFS